jgi:hypothetical protein
MLSEKECFGLRCKVDLHFILFLPLIIAIIIALTGCNPTKGSIIILENSEGTGCSMELREWSEENKCKLQLNKGDELWVEISRESGTIALSICGKNGDQAYTGNDLQSCSFSVTVSETDEYAINISGTNATGRISIHH